PDARELVACATGLRDLVLVVRKLQIEPAAVNVEARPEDVVGHGRALDVPARPALAPWRRPVWLARLGALPQHEIERIALGLVHVHARPGPQVAQTLAREAAITGEL